jgi:threonine dehydrogenase-like Zn-dependent dehydrogenase
VEPAAVCRHSLSRAGFLPGMSVLVMGDGPGACIAQLRPRGTLVIFSYVWEPRALDMGAIHMRELALVGSAVLAVG